MTENSQIAHSDHEFESSVRSSGMPPVFPLAMSAIAINAESPVPIYEQICKAIRKAVSLGDMPAGTILPTSRELATALGIGRNTVVTAYTRLVAEGYLVSNTRRGTRVSASPAGLLSFEPAGNHGRSGVDKAQMSACAIEIGYGAKHILETPLAPPATPVPFALNCPDASLYPRNHLSRLIADEFCRPPGRDTQPGQQRFQVAMAAYLRHMRGVQCEPFQIIPVTGIENALDLTARVLIDPGHNVLVEDPAPALVRQMFRAAGARISALPSDGSGPDPARVAGPPPRLIYVSPSVGFPLGSQMSETRRLALLELARGSGALIFEADAFWELSYAGNRPRAMQGSDRDGQVLYFGSLNETLGPHIRVSYLVVPRSLAEAFSEMARRAGCGPDAYVLGALGSFVADNHHAMYVRTIRSTYSRRVGLACDVLRARLAECQVLEPTGGFHVTLLFPRGLDEAAVTRLASEHGMAVSGLSSCYQHPNQLAGLVLGLGTIPERNIDTLIRRLAELVAQAGAISLPLDLAS